MRLILILGIVSALVMPKSVYAVEIPDFPSCANPRGDIQASYGTGVHGIVGSDVTYTGSDTVYRISDVAVTQCFCAENGQGIQTDWWKADALSEDDIKVLKSEGWIHVPAGELWGLAQGPYVARNSTFSCLPGLSPAPSTSGSVAGVSGGREEGGGIGGGEDEGDILGLAATGDAPFVVSVFALGILLLVTGFRRLRNR